MGEISIYYPHPHRGRNQYYSCMTASGNNEKRIHSPTFGVQLKLATLPSHKVAWPRRLPLTRGKHTPL